MKTASDYMDKYGTTFTGVDKTELEKILAEHDKEIKRMIDKMYQDVNYMYSDKEVIERVGYNKALTELKQFMEKL